MYCQVRSFDTCHKYLSRNEMPCQAVFNKISLHPFPDELKDFKKLEKFLFYMGIIFKIAIMENDGKGKFAKVKGNICNIPIEAGFFAIFFQDLQIQMD